MKFCTERFVIFLTNNVKKTSKPEIHMVRNQWQLPVDSLGHTQLWPSCFVLYWLCALFGVFCSDTAIRQLIFALYVFFFNKPTASGFTLLLSQQQAFWWMVDSHTGLMSLSCDFKLCHFLVVCHTHRFGNLILESADTWLLV